MQWSIGLLASLCLIMSGPAVVAQAAATDPVAVRIQQLTDAIPKQKWSRLTAEYITQLEGLIPALPERLSTEAMTALGLLLQRLATTWLEDAKVQELRPRYVAWCERLASHPDVGPAYDAYLHYATGEAHFVAGDLDAAITGFHRSAELSEGLRSFAHARAFRAELDRQSYRAAKQELDAARAGMDELRLVVYEAQLALRIGLFDSAARGLDQAERLVADRERAERPIDADVRSQMALVGMELAMLRQDYELVAEAAVALQQVKGLSPAVVARVRQREQQAHWRLGKPTALEPLQKLFEGANALNGPDIALQLVSQALHAGAEAVAERTAAKLLDGRSLLDPTVGLWTLLTVGYCELRPHKLPTPGSARWQEWDLALTRHWQHLLAEWREIAVDAEGLAFLQMDVRRDLLSLWLRLRRGSADGERACIERYLEADASGSTARRLQQPTVTIEAVLHELVPPRSALVVFLPAAVGSHALWLAHDSVRVFELAPEESLRQQVGELRRALADRGNGVDEATIRTLAEPIAKRLLPAELLACMANIEQLLVAGDELLHGMPVELLPIDAPERWLGLRHPISHLPSITLAMHLVRRPQAASTPHAVVLAGTSLGKHDHERWHHDPVVVSESALRGAMARVDSTQVHVLRDATPANLRFAEPRPDLVAVIAHGIYDGLLACPGGLLLAPAPDQPTGAVFATDLPAQGLPRLTFLGVCGAARGPLRLGEDGGHRLPGAILISGSDTVVATDVDVRLTDVLALLETFTQQLVAGDDASHALWRARQRLHASGAHPREWASFRLEGLPTTRIALRPADSATMRWVAAIAAGAGVALLGWYWRHRCRRQAAPTH